MSDLEKIQNEIQFYLGDTLKFYCDVFPFNKKNGIAGSSLQLFEINLMFGDVTNVNILRKIKMKIKREIKKKKKKKKKNPFFKSCFKLSTYPNLYYYEIVHPPDEARRLQEAHHEERRRSREKAVAITLVLGKTEQINGNQTFKLDECVLCFTNLPNVLFCNCGHKCICVKCEETKELPSL